MAAVEAEEGSGQRVTLPALFVGFFEVSIFAFGGPLMWARRVIVERRGWLDDAEFADILSFCQFLPGPNVVSITTCVGAKFRGGAGALAALAGFLLIPWTVGFAIGALLLHYADVGLLQNVLRGISGTAAGLIIATGLKLLMPHRRRPTAVLFAGLTFGGMALVALPLWLVMLALVPLSIAAARPEPAAPA